MEYQWENEYGYFASSDIDLTNGGTAVTHTVTFERRLTRLPEGHFILQAIVRGSRNGQGDDLGPLLQEFQVQ